MLSVRVDSVDRRMIQLESVQRRMTELTDMSRQLADVSHLQQRVTYLEQTVLTTDKTAAVDEHQTNVVDGTDTADVVHSATTDNLDALMKQINNLTARMTLAENQLMLQVLFILVYRHMHIIKYLIKLVVVVVLLLCLYFGSMVLQEVFFDTHRQHEAVQVFAEI